MKPLNGGVISMGNNKMRIEVAGSGKTYGICNDIISKGRPSSGKRILVISYTNNGCRSLENEFRLQSNGVVEDYVDILTWYHFLLAHLVKPYQTSFPGVEINQISTIDFSDDKEKSFGQRTKCYKHSDKALYLSSSSMLLKDFASEFAAKIILASNNMVIKRLEDIYEDIYFDEAQDFAGYDIEIIKALFSSKINVILVGDPLQATFATNNNNQKNKRYCGANIENLATLCGVPVSHNTISRRCNESICKFAMSISNPSYQITSGNTEICNHSGVFLVTSKDAEAYYNYFRPQCLTWAKNSKLKFGQSLNFGASKGMTFSHTILSGTKNLQEFILNGKPLDHPEKYYVAATRARFSVCIIVDKLPDDNQNKIPLDVESKKILAYRLY